MSIPEKLWSAGDPPRERAAARVAEEPLPPPAPEPALRSPGPRRARSHRAPALAALLVVLALAVGGASLLISATVGFPPHG